jgi:hypothetical protein
MAKDDLLRGVPPMYPVNDGSYETNDVADPAPSFDWVKYGAYVDDDGTLRVGVIPDDREAWSPQPNPSLERRKDALAARMFERAFKR